MGAPIGLVDPTTITMFTGIQLNFLKMLESMPAMWSSEVLEMVPESMTLVDEFYIDLSTGGFRPWTGDRQMRDLLQQAFTMKKSPFEDSAQVPKILAMNGAYQQIAGSETNRMAGNYMTFTNRAAKDVMQRGKTIIIWDGKAFFATDHPVDVRNPNAGTYKNLYTATSLTKANYAAIKAEVEGVKAPNGDPYGVTVSALIYPSGLEADAKELFIEKLANGATNAYFNDARLVKAVELNNEPTVCYLSLTRPGLSKAIAHARTPLNAQILGEASEHAATTGNVAYLADFHASTGPANPRELIRWETT